jgi:hypothetical protein
VRLRVIGGLFVAVVLVLAGMIAWALWPVTKDLPDKLAYPTAPSGSNGLTAEERQQYYHLTEGGELYPMAWLLALETEVRGKDGSVTLRPFLETIERFGMIPDPPSAYNPYGLPVGVTIGNSAVSGLQMMGLNCTACHVGELHYQGKAFRVDGGPNLSAINDFILAIFGETTAMLKKPDRLARFAERRRRVKLVRVPKFPLVDKEYEAAPEEEPDELLDSGRTGILKVLDGLRQALTTNRSLLDAKAQGLSTMKVVGAAMAISTKDGFGRTDAFGFARNELFGGFKQSGFGSGVNAIPADAPVSFPHLWGMERTSWLQWGANTNSVMERNIGQSLGVGANVDADYTSTVRVDHLSTMEGLSYKIKPPVWPSDLLGPIDEARAARGKAFFDRTCALCHETYGKTPEGLNNYQLFPLGVVGTDPNTATEFEQTVMTADGAKSFADAAYGTVEKVKEKYYKDHGIPPELQAQWERRSLRPSQTFRSTLRDYDKYPDTQNHGVYRAKTLKGIWATAPFLHNGSVPTIYDLLHYAVDRPKAFKVGTREYDPVKLGYVIDGDRFLTPPGMDVLTLDTHLPGNLNTGHEWWFYPELTDTIRFEVIEFLKTFTADGDYAFTPPAKLPANVRADAVLPIAAYSSATRNATR